MLDHATLNFFSSFSLKRSNTRGEEKTVEVMLKETGCDSKILIMLFYISDVINEKWVKFASYVSTWSTAACPTFPDENRHWRGKWIPAYGHDWHTSCEPRNHGIQASQPRHLLKSSIGPQLDRYNEFRNFIWIGIINPGSPWTFSAPNILCGKFNTTLWIM